MIAVPPLTSPDRGSLAAIRCWPIGWQINAVDRRPTSPDRGLSRSQPNRDDYYSYPEVTAPSFPKWRSAGAKALVTGFVQSRSEAA